MPKRKLTNIEYFAGTNGVGDMRVGEGAERARQVELETLAVENTLQRKKLERARQRQALGILPRRLRPRGQGYQYKRGPRGRQLPFELKAKVIGAIYRYVGHHGNMTAAQRRAAR